MPRKPLKQPQNLTSPQDAYLIELAKELKIAKIYRVDKELMGKIEEVDVVNPMPENVMN